MTSSNAIITAIVQRGRLAVHLALMHSLERVTGSSVNFTHWFKEITAALDIAAPSNCYHQFIDDILFRIIEAVPELGPLLAQPDGLEQVAGIISTAADQTISAQFSEADLTQAQATFELTFARLKDGLKGTEGDGLSDLGDELDMDIETLVKEPERIRKVFPPRNIGLGHDEITRLEDALGFSINDKGGDEGIDQYVQVLFPTLLQIVSAPQLMRHSTPPSRSPVWKWARVKKPSKHEYKFPDQNIELAITGVTNLLARMGKQSNRQEMVRYFIARHLRQEYGLGVGRGHEATEFSGFEEKRDTNNMGKSDLPPWEPSDPEAIQAYEDVDSRVMLEAVYDAAPPAQREALELYYEAEITRCSLTDLCRERGKDPNLVRNNFQALKNSVRK